MYEKYGSRVVWCLVLLGWLWTGACTGGTAGEGVPDAGEADAGGAEVAPEAPTWTRHVQSILQRRCQGCHVDGGIGPFALEGYEDVKSRASLVRWSIETGRMPPWQPADDCQSFRASRRLPAVERETILRWLALDAPLGTPVSSVPPPVPPEKLAWVDRTLQMSASYRPSFVGGDEVRCFVLAPKLDAEADLIGYEVVPGARKQVHHVLLFQMPWEEAKAREATPGGGWSCFSGPGGHSSLIGTWVPGTTAVRYPEGTGIHLQKEVGIVLQIHYAQGSAQAQDDRSGLRLQFAKSPVGRRARLFYVKDDSFVISPQAKGYTSQGRMPSPGVGTIWGVMPHMHTLGKRIRVAMLHKDGSKTCMVDIPRWDFNWQQTYFYKGTGLALGSDDQLEVSCTWDNPGTNQVKWGDTANDEMCLNYFYITR